jgi:transcriptional regulator with XRE-family HTH domain
MIQRSFGYACKFYREQLNLSQEKFALMISMDRTYYASVEAGKRNVSLQNIKKIADGFNIPMSKLLATAEKNYNKEAL